MNKIFSFSLGILLCLVGSSQTLKSPEQFLGYKIGSRFTPHYKIAAYVRAVAEAVPSLVKVEKYGETYEGRELLLAFVSSAGNMQQLETIRENNLRLTGTAAGNANSTNAPAIVWLSYNVHGNEPSSSEAAMLTLYALVDPTNNNSRQYLNNTVVVIDPCLNPDGRDRYVNWFNSVRSKEPDPSPNSREHIEPWPGGRTNHYHFDLNRDWAWQTQQETRQRLAKYNQWMPHVHVDFHEQFYNDPYYFAPAAEPFHEVITQWQREFQTTIGKNNARYFDEQGWLYFTRESFDLLYPAYGDTYPTYSGAIGMTYEQAGHGNAGLSVRTGAGDTLTLADRAQHHFTSSMSTIEVASQNASRLVSEFAKFFAESRSGKNNPVKTYLMTSNSREKIQKLADLLTMNGITYGRLASPSFRGTSYSTGKLENGQLQKHHIAVSALQPRSVLAKVLLDPNTHLPDTNTYDITAWALPYAHGVDAYTVKEALTILPATSLAAEAAVQPSSYGYLVKHDCVASARIMSTLLKEGYRIRYAERSFTYQGKTYDRGTMIILVQGNKPGVRERLETLARNNDIEVAPLSGGLMEQGPDIGSPYMRNVKTPRVALVTGDRTSSQSGGQVWHFFEQELDYPLTRISASDVANINLADFTVVIFPNGQFNAFSDKAINDKLKDYVRSGGKIIALENAVNQMAAGDWGIKLSEQKAEEEKPDYSYLKTYANRDRQSLSDFIPGAIYRVQMDDTHPLAFGYGPTYYTLKINPNVYDYLKDGWNVGYLKKDNHVTGFAGTNVRNRLVDALNFGVQNIGGGSVIYFVDDPLFRQFWENGKLMFANAVFFVGQ